MEASSFGVSDSRRNGPLDLQASTCPQPAFADIQRGRVDGGRRVMASITNTNLLSEQSSPSNVASLVVVWGIGRPRKRLVYLKAKSFSFFPRPSQPSPSPSCQLKPWKADGNFRRAARTGSGHVRGYWLSGGRRGWRALRHDVWCLPAAGEARLQIESIKQTHAGAHGMRRKLVASTGDDEGERLQR